MKMSDVKKVVEDSTHSNRWIASMGAGAVIGGLFAGPFGVVTGLGFGALGYPPLYGAVRVGLFLRQTYHAFNHSEDEHAESVTESDDQVATSDTTPRSSYATAHLTWRTLPESVSFQEDGSEEEEIALEEDADQGMALNELFDEQLPFDEQLQRDSSQNHSL